MQCDRTIALDALFQQLLSRDNISKLAVLGCGCSVATEPTAEVSHYYNVTHVRWIDYSPYSGKYTEFPSDFLFHCLYWAHWSHSFPTLLPAATDNGGHCSHLCGTDQPLPMEICLPGHTEWKSLHSGKFRWDCMIPGVESQAVNHLWTGYRCSQGVSEWYQDWLHWEAVWKQYQHCRTQRANSKLSQSLHMTIMIWSLWLQDPRGRIFIVASYVRHARAFLCEVITSPFMVQLTKEPIRHMTMLPVTKRKER